MRLLIINLKLKSQIAKLSTFLLLAVPVQQQITIFTAIREAPKGHWPAKAELE
jgi:hypothetical protein